MYLKCQQIFTKVWKEPILCLRFFSILNFYRVKVIKIRKTRDNHFKCKSRVFLKRISFDRGQKTLFCPSSYILIILIMTIPTF